MTLTIRQHLNAAADALGRAGCHPGDLAYLHACIEAAEQHAVAALKALDDADRLWYDQEWPPNRNHVVLPDPAPPTENT